MGISERESKNQKRYHPLKGAHCFFLNWVVVFLCLFTSSHLFADLTPYFEKKLPVQTLALVVIPDCQALQGTALKTPLGKTLNHPQFRPYGMRFIPVGLGVLVSNEFRLAFLNIPVLQKKVTSAFLALVAEPQFTNTFLPELKALLCWELTWEQKLRHSRTCFTPWHRVKSFPHTSSWNLLNKHN
jgi:hypothetical protein